MLGNTIHALTDAGYQYIGIDHFAKPDDELAIAQREGQIAPQFSGYTTHGNCDLLGLGCRRLAKSVSYFAKSNGFERLSKSHQCGKIACGEGDFCALA